MVAIYNLKLCMDTKYYPNFSQSFEHICSAESNVCYSLTKIMQECISLDALIGNICNECILRLLYRPNV